MKDKKIEKKKTISQGWECPKCGSVYAIWVSECPTCKNSNIKITTRGYTFCNLKRGENENLYLRLL